MKKLLFIGAVVLGTYAFSACESKPAAEEGTVVDTDTIVEVDTAVQQTIVETDTATRVIEGEEGTDTIQ